MAQKSDRSLDAAEQWLRDNDPHYASKSRAWHTPREDALERAPKSVDSKDVDLEQAVRDGRKVRIPGTTGGHGAFGIPAVIGIGSSRTKPTKDSDA